MVLPLALVLFMLIALPVYFLHGIWRAADETRLLWWLKVAYSAAFVVFIILTGRWDWISYHVRFVIPMIFGVVVATGLVRLRRRQLPWSDPGTRANVLGAAAALAVGVVLVVLAACGLTYSGPAVQFEFPLQEGTYYIAQGGNSPFINYHNTHREQRYALDIVALNSAGARASRLFSTDVERYVIYGHVVRSPCQGTVVETDDGLADLPPPERDPTEPAGNHVILACDDVRVELAHLQRGSVAVKLGDTVRTGQPLGRVGNSGNTSEPHLHVHAFRLGADGKGDGVPILFNDVFAVRNTRLVREPDAATRY